MTANAWQQWGRELTPEDAARFARSRRDKTAGFETLKGLGCRVKEGYRFPSGDKFVTGDGIGFPRRTTFDGKVEFGGVKVRHMDRKLFAIEHNTAPHSLYNLDTVNSLEDVYVVEGEPDVAVMEEAGFRAVSVTTGSQKKYDKQSIYMLAAAKRIFIVGDQGAKKPWETDPGEACMDALQKELTDHSPETAAKVFRVRFDDAHDVSELASQKRAEFAATIEHLRDLSLGKTWITENIPTIKQLPTEPQR